MTKGPFACRSSRQAAPEAQSLNDFGRLNEAPWPPERATMVSGRGRGQRPLPPEGRQAPQLRVSEPEMSLVSISRNLCRAIDALSAQSGAAFTYNPLQYARVPHERYLKTFGEGPKEVLLLGMNPGPFGMAQTGIPFGDVAMVRDFLGINGKVNSPELTHVKRPISGFQCKRSEVSGTRLWGFAREKFGTPEHFFQRFFVVNYCPLVFMEESSRNLTPDKLPKNYREELFALCDEALLATTRELAPSWVLGVGAFAQKRAAVALKTVDVKVDTILHPSPASPKANRGWALEVERQLTALGIQVPVGLSTPDR